MSEKLCGGFFVFLSGGLGLFLVACFIAVVGFSLISWHGWIFSAIGGLVGVLLYKAFNGKK